MKHYTGKIDHQLPALSSQELGPHCSGRPFSTHASLLVRLSSKGDGDGCRNLSAHKPRPPIKPVASQNKQKTRCQVLHTSETVKDRTPKPEEDRPRQVIHESNQSLLKYCVGRSGESIRNLESGGFKQP